MAIPIDELDVLTGTRPRVGTGSRHQRPPVVATKQVKPSPPPVVPESMASNEAANGAKPLTYSTVCFVAGCDRLAGKESGLCTMHRRRLARQRRGARPMYAIDAPPQPRHATCTSPGCDLPHRARGLCNRHYLQAKRRASGMKPRTPAGQCEICGGRIFSHGLCRQHRNLYLRFCQWPSCSPRWWP
jgi:hypothetical protein